MEKKYMKSEKQIYFIHLHTGENNFCRVMGRNYFILDYLFWIERYNSLSLVDA